jgi:hypothetical protein
MRNRDLIRNLAKEYGVNNLRFFIPMHPMMVMPFMGIGMVCTSDPEVRVECVIDERRYKALDGYKVEFRPVEPEKDGMAFGYRSFYQSDLSSLISKYPDEYSIYVLVDEDNKYEKIRIEG